MLHEYDCRLPSGGPARDVEKALCARIIIGRPRNPIGNPMNPTTLNALSIFPEQLAAHYAAIPQKFVHWAPASWEGIPSERFTPIEQVCHVRDIEIDGYQVRLHRVLSESNPTLPSIDSEALAVQRSYATSNAQEALAVFRAARAKTVGLISSLTAEEFSRTAVFEGYGTVSLRSLVHYLCSHDQQHLAGLQWAPGQDRSCSRRATVLTHLPAARSGRALLSRCPCSWRRRPTHRCAIGPDCVKVIPAADSGPYLRKSTVLRAISATMDACDPRTAMSTLPVCPQCKSDLTYQDGQMYVCPECAHEWSPAVAAPPNESAESENTVRDVNGSILQNGDTVIVVKDLPVKGASSALKAGTKVKGIRLVEGDHNIDCRIEGFGGMRLKSEFVKKS